MVTVIQHAVGTEERSGFQVDDSRNRLIVAGSKKKKKKKNPSQFLCQIETEVDFLPVSLAHSQVMLLKFTLNISADRVSLKPGCVFLLLMIEALNLGLRVWQCVWTAGGLA